MSTAREDVLGRVRKALGDGRAPGVEIPRDYRQAGAYDAGDTPDALLEKLVDRLEDYKASVFRCGRDEVAATVTAALDAGLGEGWAPSSVLAAPGVPDDWRPDGVAGDPGGEPVALAERAASMTGAAVAIAETGTIVLDGSPVCGRRALTLLPDCLVCVVTADQVVRGVPESLGRLNPLAPLTMISGPSATSDIELQRVEGVHGPRTLLVVLVT
jgi:L-lactate dehydrogenase complex protein LldG